MALGPQAHHAYEQLHRRITTGRLVEGTRLPPQLDLAADLGVSLVTLRQALAWLQQEGLIVCVHGRGTYVSAPAERQVLLVEDSTVQRTVLAAYVQKAGYPCTAVATPREGVATLERSRTITVVLTDLRMPTAADGIGFIQTVHQRWPDLPVVAVTAYPDDLRPLQGQPEHPVLILTKPVIEAQIRRVLTYTLERGTALAHQPRPGTAVS